MTIAAHPARRYARAIICWLLIWLPWAVADVVQEFSLVDRLAFDWRQELVVIELNDAAAAAPSLVLRGPAGTAMPWQRVEHEGRPHAAFLADLAPLATDRYALVAAAGEPFESPIVVERAETMVRLSNGLTGIAVPTAEGAWLDGPLAGLRLAEGAWVGRSQLSGGPAMTGYELTVTAEGPVYAEAVCRYRFANEETWTVRVRVIAGEPVVLITETSTLKEPTDWRFVLPPEVAPTHALSRVHYNNQVPGSARQGELLIQPVGDRRPMTLRPWVIWSHPNDGCAFTLFRLPADMAATREDGDGWRFGPALKPPTGLDLEKKPAVPSLEPPGPPPDVQIADALLLGAGNAASWCVPGEAGFNRHIPFRLLADGGLELQLANRQPGRDWFIGSAPLVAKAGFIPTSELIQPHALTVKHFDRPYDRVRRMVLDWPMDATVPRPRIFPREDELARWREIGGELRPDSGTRLLVKRSLLKPADAALSRQAAEAAVASAESAAEVFLTARKGDRRRGGYGVAPHELRRPVHQAVGAADLALARGALTDEEARLLRARLAYIGYNLASEDFHSPRLGLVNHPNMTTFAYGSLGILANVLADHPEAPNWIAMVQAEFDRELDAWAGPNGGWYECPHYQTSLEQMIYFGLSSRRTGLSDFVYDKRLKLTLLYLAKLSTPPNPDFAGRRHFPPIGNTYLLETSMLFTLMADIWRERDPEYARTMQWVWESQGRPYWSGIGGEADIHWISEFHYAYGLEGRQPEWDSELFPAAGAVFRHGFGTDRETYMVYHQGRSIGHYDDDQGSFEMWGLGRPLMVDWGYNGRMPAHQHNRVDLGGTGRIVDFSAQPAADYLRGQQAGWERRILLVKPPRPGGHAYFVIHDAVAADAERAGNGWWWFNTGEPLRFVPGGLRMRGRDDVDLLVAMPPALLGTVPCTDPPVPPPKAPGADEPDDFFVLDPAARPKVVDTVDLAISAVTGSLKGNPTSTGGLTRQKGLRLPIAAGSSQLLALVPLPHDAAPPTVTWLDGQRVFRVAVDGGYDLVFLADEPFDYADDEVRFHGSVGLVQVRGDQVTLTLAAPGEIVCRGQEVRQ